MISFSHPWALLFLLPAAWLLWRSRRKTVDTHVVANLFLWLDAADTTRKHEGHRRATPAWLIWLQAAVLAALALAIASPSRISDQPGAILLVDVSLSMSARSGATSRFELARALARPWVDERSSRRVRIFAAGADVIEVPSVDQLQLTGDHGDIAAAVLTARRLSDEVMVITDRPAPRDATVRVGWQQIGEPADNVAITALTATRDGAAILEVSNFGRTNQPISMRVDGGSAPWTKAVELRASETRAFVLPAGADRTLTATLEAADSGNAIAGDDRRIASIRSAKPQVLVTTDQPAVNDALEALPDITLENGTAPQGLRPDIVVTDGVRAAGIASLVFVHAKNATIPHIARTEADGVRTATVSIDLENSPWTLTPAFPIFVADAIDWLSRRPATSLSRTDIDLASESDTLAAVAPDFAELEPAPVPAAARSLWMVLAIAALIGVAAEMFFRRPVVTMRVAGAMLIAAAFAGTSLPVGDPSRTAAVALDSSASVAGNQRQAGDRIRRETESAGADDRIETARFGGVETDIAAGLRNARATLPSFGDRRIVLISDGQETNGDAAAEARAIGAAGVPVDVIPLDSRVPAFIERMDAPMSVRADAPVALRTSVKGTPGESLRLTVTRNGRELESRRVVLNDAGEASVSRVDTASEPGVASYRAVLTDERLGLVLSESGVAVTVAGRGRLLVISDADRRAASRPFIRSATLDVVDVAPEATPDTREALGSFSAIVINGVAPHRLTARQQDAIASAVSIDGAGLLFFGSKASLEASDFSPAPLADALPIDFTALPRPPSTGSSLALLVDISGSMASTSDGVTKISAARDAIVRAIAVTPKTDAIEVIGFAVQPQLLIGPDDPRDATSITEKLKSLSPSGSTALAPAVIQAVAWLTRAPNQRRRLLLVTDGKTSVSDAEATRAAVTGQSIEVSVVTIGSDAERAWLGELAASTGGRAYFPDRLTDLSREVAREAARGITGREINERFTIRNGAHALAVGNFSPQLDGLIAARLRAGATAAWKGPGDAPVLAAWPRGLGRVAAFSSDIAGAWTEPLRAWPGNAAFWSRAIEWLARDADNDAIESQLSIFGGEPRIVVDLGARVPSTVPIELPSVSATIIGPAGQPSVVALHAVTATRFEGAAALGEAGDYRAAINVTNPLDQSEQRLTRGWYWTGDCETQSRGLNLPLLEDIARASGGRVLPAIGTAISSSDTIFAGSRHRRPVNAAPWLLIAAIAFLSFDYLRRTSGVS